MNLRDLPRCGFLVIATGLAMAWGTAAMAEAQTGDARPKKARAEQPAPGKPKAAKPAAAKPVAEKAKPDKPPAVKPAKPKAPPPAQEGEAEAAGAPVTEAAPAKPGGRQRRPLSEDVDADLVQLPKPDEIIPPNAPLREDEEQAIAKLRQNGFAVRFDPNAAPPPAAAAVAAVQRNRFQKGDAEVSRRVNELGPMAAKPAAPNNPPPAVAAAPPAPAPLEGTPAKMGSPYFQRQPNPAPASAPSAPPAAPPNPNYPPVEDRSIDPGGLTAGPIEPNQPPAQPAPMNAPPGMAPGAAGPGQTNAEPLFDQRPPPGTASPAVNEYRARAEQGDPAAQTQLAEMYQTGRGVDKDLRQAFTWYEQAAQRGDAEAQYSLGNMYFMGEGVPQDDTQAATWYRRAADQGHTAAKQNLENLYRVRQGAQQP